MTDQTIEWLRGLAEKGGKGVVNNIDARCLGRIADDLERLRKALETISSDGKNCADHCRRQARRALASGMGK